MSRSRSILAWTLSMTAGLALAATASAQEYPGEYPGQYPVEAAPPQVVDAVPPAPPAPPQLPPQGQWVNTAEYGMVWIPAGASAYAIGGNPYAYLYTPTYGWTWYASPWGWGPCVVGGPWVHRPFPFGFRAWVHGSRGWAWHHRERRGYVYGAPRTVYVAPQRPVYGPRHHHHHYVAPSTVYVAPRRAAPPAYRPSHHDGWGGGPRYSAPSPRYSAPSPGRYGAVQARPAPSPGRYGAVQAAPAPSPGRYGAVQARPAPSPGPGRYGAGPARAPSGGGGRGPVRMGGERR